MLFIQYYHVIDLLCADVSSYTVILTNKFEYLNAYRTTVQKLQASA